MQPVLWVVLVLAVVLVAVGAVLFLRRHRQGREERSSVFPPSTATGGGQVRLLEDDDTALEARIEALRGEVTALRREAAYAEQRGLDRRAERLRELIAEREAELQKHGPADERAG